jgi:DNA-directed RNA polymerase
MLDPMRMALPTKPRDWVDYYNGGYETFNDPFVMNRPSKANYDFFSINTIYTACNNVQRVPWQINEDTGRGSEVLGVGTSVRLS